MFRSLALGGGGVRAGLQIGALRALEETRGSLVFPDGYWGCSAGAIVATALAFNLTVAQIAHLFQSHMALSKSMPPLRLSSFADLPTTKGLFPMDQYEAHIVEAFRLYGIDLTTKTIADAPHPLHIVASNMTTKMTTIFTKQVRILDAIRCSSCLPFVFQPQVLYNNVYLDGGVMVDCLDSLVPDDCLVLHISELPTHLYASRLETMDFTSYLYAIYRCARTRPVKPNVLWLRNSSVSILQELTSEQKEALVEDGYSSAVAFLTKRVAKERKDVSGGALPAVVCEE